MKTKIEIKSIFGNILFEFEKENNTIKETIEEAVKSGANLRDANLCGANLRDADLCGADLRDANLCGADLRDADLRGAYLCGADLRDAYLCGAYLCGADLRGANYIPYIPLACPSDGAFIGWKKVNGKLVQLEIPADAKRSSATTMKCRCSKAMVISITNIDGSNEVDEVLNTLQVSKCLYKVGQLVIPDSFDEDRWNECSHGIHFFINKEDAINY